MSSYDGYSGVCLSCQVSPINLTKTKISILKSQLKISALDNQINQDFSIRSFQTNTSSSHCKKGNEIKSEIHPQQCQHHNKTQTSLFRNTFISASGKVPLLNRAHRDLRLLCKCLLYMALSSV